MYSSIQTTHNVVAVANYMFGADTVMESRDAGSDRPDVRYVYGYASDPLVAGEKLGAISAQRLLRKYNKEHLDVQGIAGVLSSAPDEFDPYDMDDQRLFAERAKACIEAAFPGTEYLLAIQNDGKSGLLHAHFLVPNVYTRGGSFETRGKDGQIKRIEFTEGQAIKGAMRRGLRFQKIVDQTLQEQFGIDNAQYMRDHKRFGRDKAERRDFLEQLDHALIGTRSFDEFVTKAKDNGIAVRRDNARGTERVLYDFTSNTTHRHHSGVDVAAKRKHDYYDDEVSTTYYAGDPLFTDEIRSPIGRSVSFYRFTLEGLNEYFGQQGSRGKRVPPPPAPPQSASRASLGPSVPPVPPRAAPVAPAQPAGNGSQGDKPRVQRGSGKITGLRRRPVDPKKKSAPVAASEPVYAPKTSTRFKAKAKGKVKDVTPDTTTKTTAAPASEPVTPKPARVLGLGRAELGAMDDVLNKGLAQMDKKYGVTSTDKPYKSSLTTGEGARLVKRLESGNTQIVTPDVKKSDEDSKNRESYSSIISTERRDVNTSVKENVEVMESVEVATKNATEPVVDTPVVVAVQVEEEVTESVADTPVVPAPVASTPVEEEVDDTPVVFGSVDQSVLAKRKHRGFIHGQQLVSPAEAARVCAVENARWRKMAEGSRVVLGPEYQKVTKAAAKRRADRREAQRVIQQHAASQPTQQKNKDGDYGD